MMKCDKNIPVFVLCGGKSSRMKTEKGLVLYKGKTFMQRILEAVRPVSENIFLITENQDYSRFGYPLIADLYKEKGPLGGIYTALSHSNAHLNLVLSCDIPKISTEVLDKLISKAKSSKAEICFLSDTQKNHPLIATYSREVKPAIYSALMNNELRLQDFVKKRNHICTYVGKGYEDTLKNINTKKELDSLI